MNQTNQARMNTYRNIIVLYYSYLAKIQGMKHTLLINPPQHTLRKTMVHNESFVLPSAVAFRSNSDKYQIHQARCR